MPTYLTFYVPNRAPSGITVQFRSYAEQQAFVRFEERKCSRQEIAYWQAISKTERKQAKDALEIARYNAYLEWSSPQTDPSAA